MERKIEKWLRGFAKKRRDQAGPPFELPPARRRLLHDEIARTSQDDDEDNSFSLWEVLRQQWAVLLAFAACIFLVASIFLPVLDLGRKKAAGATTMQSLGQIGSAIRSAADKNNGLLPVSLDAAMWANSEGRSEAENRKKIVYVAGGLNLKDLPSNAVLAYAPEGEGGGAILFANGRTRTVNLNEFARLTNGLAAVAIADNRFVASAQPVETPAPALARMPGKVATSIPAGGGAGRIAFAGKEANAGTIRTFGAAPEVPPGLQNSFKNTVAPFQRLSVLSSFHVQQNGDALRIVDQDGSIYTGWLYPDREMPVTAVNSRSIPQENPAPGYRMEGAMRQAEKTTETGGLKNYYFEVKGESRTLNETVVFSGRLIGGLSAANVRQGTFGLEANSTDSGGAVQDMLKPGSTNQPAQLLWSQLRIAGTAVVSGTNYVEVNAAPLRNNDGEK